MSSRQGRPERGGTCDGVTYCDPSTWSVCPLPVTSAACSDFDSDSNPDGIHCVVRGGLWGVDVDSTGTLKADSSKIEPCGTTGNGFHFVGKGHSCYGAPTRPLPS